MRSMPVVLVPMFLAVGLTWSVLVAQDQAQPKVIRLGDAVFANAEAVVAAGARCGTPQPTEEQLKATANLPRGFKANANGMVVIPVHFVHVVNGIEGYVTEQQREQQVAVLNNAFNSHGFEFCYNPNGDYPPKTVNNSSWFTMSYGTAAELACKSSQGIDPHRVLNFYTCRPGGGLLGWATFPFPAVNLQLDGVVCLDESLPGGAAEPYNLGETGTHEVGHWLGLFHTFQGGCDGIGDQVDDTQDHPNPNFGCPNFGASCNPPASSPVRNFMNYVDDPCMDHFTVGQGERMRAIVAQFRPQLGSKDCGGISCSLVNLQAEAQKFLPFPLTSDDFDSLRQYRDLVLNRSEIGRELSQTYYRHGNEVTRLLLQRPQLLADSLLMLKQHLPKVSMALENDGVVQLSTSEFERGLKLLARLNESASSDLQTSLARVEQLLRQSVTTFADHVEIAFPQTDAARPFPLQPIPEPLTQAASR